MRTTDPETTLTVTSHVLLRDAIVTAVHNVSSPGVQQYSSTAADVHLSDTRTVALKHSSNGRVPEDTAGAERVRSKPSNFLRCVAILGSFTFLSEVFFCFLTKWVHSCGVRLGVSVDRPYSYPSHTRRHNMAPLVDNSTPA